MFTCIMMLEIWSRTLKLPKKCAGGSNITELPASPTRDDCCRRYLALNYRILIEEIEILTQLYRTVVIPRTVQDELLRSSAPELVRAWLAHTPEWLQVRGPLGAADPSLAALDPSERDAILIASEVRADQLIVDDRQGRREALKRGIPVLGTLGVLREAAVFGFVDLRVASP